MRNGKDEKQYLSEAYLRKKLESEKVFPLVSTILNDLCFDGNHLKLSINSDDWAKDSKLRAGTTFNRGSPKQWWAPVFTYNIFGRFYRPDGKVVFGPLQDVQEADDLMTGQFKPYDDEIQSPIEINISHETKLTHTKSSSLTEGVQIDLTAKESVSYAGVSGELEQHLGIDVSKETAQSSSKETTETIDETIPINPGEKIVVVFTKSTKRYNADFDIDAVADCGFEVEIRLLPSLKWGHRGNAKYILSPHNKGLWEKQHGTFHSFKVNNIHDFCGLIRGYDVRAPALREYCQHHMSKAAHNALLALENEDTLHLSFSGSQQIVNDHNASFAVRDVVKYNGDRSKYEDLFGKDVAGQPLPRD